MRENGFFINNNIPRVSIIRRASAWTIDAFVIATILLPLRLTSIPLPVIIGLSSCLWFGRDFWLQRFTVMLHSMDSLPYLTFGNESKVPKRNLEKKIDDISINHSLRSKNKNENNYKDAPTDNLKQEFDANKGNNRNVNNRNRGSDVVNAHDNYNYEEQDNIGYCNLVPLQSPGRYLTNTYAVSLNGADSETWTTMKLNSIISILLVSNDFLKLAMNKQYQMIKNFYWRVDTKGSNPTRKRQLYLQTIRAFHRSLGLLVTFAYGWTLYELLTKQQTWFDSIASVQIVDKKYLPLEQFDHRNYYTYSADTFESEYERKRMLGMKNVKDIKDNDHESDHDQLVFESDVMPHHEITIDSGVEDDDRPINI